MIMEAYIDMKIWNELEPDKQEASLANYPSLEIFIFSTRIMQT